MWEDVFYSYFYSMPSGMLLGATIAYSGPRVFISGLKTSGLYGSFIAHSYDPSIGYQRVTVVNGVWSFAPL